MRLALVSITAVLLAAPALAETRTYNLRDFTRLKVDTAYQVEFIQGPVWSVVVDSRTNEFDSIIVEKSGEALVVRRKESAFNDRDRKRDHHDLHDVVRITAPTLKALEFNTAVGFKADRLDVAALDIDAHTAAKIDIASLKADTLTISGKAAAVFDLTGQCGRLTVDLDAASKIDATGLKCREVDVEADAASTARVFASSSASADASSVSTIRISGKPAKVSQHSDGLSKVVLED